MNNKLPNIIAAVVVVFALIFIVKYLKTNFSSAAKEPEKGITDVMKEDDKRLRPTEKEMAGISESSEQNSDSPESAKNMTKGFRALSEEETVAAQQIFEMAIAQRKMARLPGMTYKQMVDYCRQLTEKYPGTVFEEKARLMMSEVPADQRASYGITEQEISPKK